MDETETVDVKPEWEQRADVVRIALEWERTPYVHQGRIKGLAADCTFFAKVFEEAGLIPTVAIPPYSAQAHLNRSASLYLPLVERYAKREIDETHARPGDVVMYLLARTWSHGAVIINPGWPTIIHADLGARHVIRARGNDGVMRGAPRRFFSFW